jgi:hypothetical protein
MGQIHMYYATGKVLGGQDVVDRRFFVRSILRHADLADNTPTTLETMHRCGLVCVCVCVCVWCVSSGRVSLSSSPRRMA